MGCCGRRGSDGDDDDIYLSVLGQAERLVGAEGTSTVSSVNLDGRRCIFSRWQKMKQSETKYKAAGREVMKKGETKEGKIAEQLVPVEFPASWEHMDSVKST